MSDHAKPALNKTAEISALQIRMCSEDPKHTDHTEWHVVVGYQSKNITRITVINAFS